MTPESAAVSADDRGREFQDQHGRFRFSATVLAGALLVVGLLHFETIQSIVQIWFRSETFLHGLLIFPISGWLVWRRWPQLKKVGAQPWYPAVAVIGLVSLLWWLSESLGIQVSKQLMVIALLPTVVLLINGPAFTKTIAFPLAYLVFAVPFGEAAIPYLIDFTAFFVVEALQLTGFPVFRDGVYFSIPAGNFEVAKACSGIRYLLASLALGTLYGYLIFSDLKKRVAFAIFALLLPIVANGLRAYGIVLLAHFSDMKIAVGVDHLIFGWIFFGFVMLFMFWVGDRLRDAGDVGGGVAHLPSGSVQGGASRGAIVLAALLAIGGVATGPALATTMSWVSPQLPPAGLPARAGDWLPATAHRTDWQPVFRGASYIQIATYQRDQVQVDLVVIRYDEQHQGIELVNSTNAVADSSTWEFGNISVQERYVPEAGLVLLRETEIFNTTRERLIWSWNEVNGLPVSGDLQTKVMELGSTLRFRRPISSAIVVSAIVHDDVNDSREILEQFIKTSWQSVHDCLYPETDGHANCFRRELKIESREH